MPPCDDPRETQFCCCDDILYHTKKDDKKKGFYLHQSIILMMTSSSSLSVTATKTVRGGIIAGSANDKRKTTVKNNNNDDGRNAKIAFDAKNKNEKQGIMTTSKRRQLAMSAAAAVASVALSVGRPMDAQALSLKGKNKNGVYWIEPKVRHEYPLFCFSPSSSCFNSRFLSSP